ncbi:MAG: hypothetical protein IPP74_13185 [Alphaproteobacteria bacterium]|nr:hypothetical protein [Alphaproteobacteria bacterium]
MSKEYQDFELGPDGLEAECKVVRFLSMEELQKVLLVPGLSVLRMHRGPGKSDQQTEVFRKVLEAWETKEIIDLDSIHLLQNSRYGKFKAEDHIADLHRYAMLPGLSPGKTQMQTDAFLSIIENEWPLTPKPKKTYKPHSFQPAKGEAPTSCKPNPKTVAKNRAKRKLKKK